MVFDPKHGWSCHKRKLIPQRSVVVVIGCYVNDIWNKSYMNCGNEMKMKKWSSQWKQFMQLGEEAWKKIQNFNGTFATSRVQTTLKSWIFFSGFFTQLHKLLSLRRSFLHDFRLAVMLSDCRHPCSSVLITWLNSCCYMYLSLIVDKLFKVTRQVSITLGVAGLKPVDNPKPVSLTLKPEHSD